MATTVLLVFVATSVGPLPGWSRLAQAEVKRPRLALIPLGRRGKVGHLAARRIEEYLRAMVEAGNVVTLIPSEDVDAGRVGARGRRGRRKLSRAERKLAKADQAAVTGRGMLESKQDLPLALKLLGAAIKTYEKYVAELVDFTKLIDAYQQGATVAVQVGGKRNLRLARQWLTRAITLQPTFVVNARTAHKDLQTLVTRIRAKLMRSSDGVIKVVCDEPGGIVFIDGVKLGDAPAVAKDLAHGTHYVQVRKTGSKPWGKSIAIKNDKVQMVKVYLVKEDLPEDDIALSVQPSDIKPFANKGNFHERLFRNFSFMFARQLQARYLLYGVVAGSGRGIELHLFLFDAQVRRTVALKPVYFAHNLNDMQMKILEAEGHIRAAVRSLPTDREVTELPEIYQRTEETTASPLAPPVTTGPATTTSTSTSTTTTPPKPRPSVVRPATTTPRPTTPRTSVDPYAGLVRKKDDEGGIASKWWFWTGIGAVLVGGGVATYLLLQGQPTPANNFKVTARLP